MIEQTKIDHKLYPKTLKSKTYMELMYIINDASEAIKAMPEGHKAGYYADEINYCSMEITKR